jgi:ABC-type antimicrobial peptide transport system permease subunit
MAHAVGQRTREIGVRLALGADRRAIAALVAAQGARMVALGTVAGLAVALAAARLIQARLFGVGPTDPLTFAAVVAVLVAAALLACLVPARRATKVDPLEALRYE